ncbi:hypothetical protein HH214_17815 [Mucilaginibacter robiniae]|uniref:Lipoprotein n=1 Tax=Mucilaginibacter robiniae TaxID=2728022 RepID=A0A7L5E5L1_9SPHI|nr:hypothetical protein [Mucilaginibacter robiniae]QJD97599.1 hypothetical protein HH214_17815 [Mucilaginibacter robiniae]
MKNLNLNGLFISPILVALLTILGCKKTSNVIEADGAIKDTGSVAADGCGWIIVINSIYYHPDNLMGNYEVNNLNVHVKYTLDNSTKFGCGINANTLPVIHIKSIEKR